MAPAPLRRLTDPSAKSPVTTRPSRHRDRAARRARELAVHPRIAGFLPHRTTTVHDTKATRMTWNIAPGTAVARADLHDAWGGRIHPRISPTRHNHIFLFTSKSATYDGWDGWDGWDGTVYRFLAEGKRGDHTVSQGNRAVLEHAQSGRALRLFTDDAGEPVYVGEFAVDPGEPTLAVDLPDAKGGPRRAGLVFRLAPVGDIHLPGLRYALPHTIPSSTVVQIGDELAAEAQPADTPTRNSRRLLRAYRLHLRGRGHVVVRHRIHPSGEAEPFHTDLLDTTADELVVARGVTTRDAALSAVGELLDCRRFFTPAPALALLSPSRPRPDVLAYCHSADISVIWPVDDEAHTFDRADAPGPASSS